MMYCTSKLSSVGCTNSISTSAPCSAPQSGLSDFFVTCTDVQSLKNGLLFGGVTGPAAIPFSGGILCVRSPPLRRGPVMNSGGAGPNTCTRTYSLLVNDGAVLPAGLGGPGGTVWYPWWYRDPVPTAAPTMAAA